MQPIKHFWSIFLLTLLVFASCKKDDADGTGDSSDSTSVFIDNTPMQQGKWKVSLYQENGKDETSQFSGYEFTFKNDGVVNAVKANYTVTGGWIQGSGSRYGKFILSFGQTAPFEDISEDWTILEKTASRLRLEHTSGGDGSKDVLTFDKL
ncbi:hypothetical protein V9K67_26930 [Paraflavisolibacter sp. H34]|uniref:hypothetical protein n=1 Tax=Huijunlia imazamoxiresistens TaxID=3127457 RepID=UPI00301B340D